MRRIFFVEDREQQIIRKWYSYEKIQEILLLMHLIFIVVYIQTAYLRYNTDSKASRSIIPKRKNVF